MFKFLFWLAILDIVLFPMISGIYLAITADSYPAKYHIEKVNKHNESLVKKLVSIKKSWSEKALLEYITCDEVVKNDQ